MKLESKISRPNFSNRTELNNRTATSDKQTRIWIRGSEADRKWNLDQKNTTERSSLPRLNVGRTQLFYLWPFFPSSYIRFVSFFPFFLFLVFWFGCFPLTMEELEKRERERGR
jgi:hypothetical protein